MNVSRRSTARIAAPMARSSFGGVGQRAKRVAFLVAVVVYPPALHHQEVTAVTATTVAYAGPEGAARWP